MIKLSVKEKDIFEEIGNIGTGNASRALSSLTGCQIRPVKPQVLVLNKQDIKELLADSGKTIIYGDIDISGSIKGKAVMIFSAKDVKVLVSRITKRHEIELNEEETQTMREIFNIFSGNYLGSLSEFLDMKIMHSLPKIYFGSSEEITERLRCKEDQFNILCIKTVVMIEESQVSGLFLIVLDEENAAKLLEFIKTKFGS